jgi:sporulation protein YlmC with PRC-barrel domain
MEDSMSANIPVSGDVAVDESGNLISASKVTGTNVYNAAREKLGSVYDVMLNKQNGQVAYAIMSFGGFFGMGESYHPLPWRALRYDTGVGGYVVDIDRNRLEGAPHYMTGTEPDWSDRAYSQSIDHYYGY